MSSPVPDVSGIDISRLAAMGQVEQLKLQEHQGVSNTFKVGYRCGTSYLLGLAGGGIYGGVTGWKQGKLLLSELKHTTAINAMATKGGQWGVACGAVALYYTGGEWVAENVRQRRDWVNAAIGGGVGFGLFRILQIKRAALYGTAGAVLVGGMAYAFELATGKRESSPWAIARHVTMGPTK